jgi:GT2 family glycosyltransferase
MSDPIPVLIVPTLNGHDRLQDMLESIDYPIDQVIVVDNGGTEHQWVKPDWVDTLDVIRVPSNLGVAGSWNLGIKSSPFAPYWLIVNDDVTFAPGSLARFAYEGEWVGAISLCADLSPWCAFTLGQDVVTVVGLFDEAYYPAYFEDTDYARRAMEMMGSDIVYHTDIAVNHANSSTINGGYAEQNQRTYHVNKEMFDHKLSLNMWECFHWQLKSRRANDWSTSHV